ncbi:MAG: DUF4886 domain-containing protein [Candidatus Izemoplasmatales bacterium]|nr:DUF4886 domain-containing protein [Candidatus Izemoplasmatales bacterium]
MKKFAFFFLSVFAFAALIGCKTTETNVYSVDFVVYDGYSMESLSLADGASIPEPTAPVREGYTFDGWFKESSLSTPWNFATDTVTENVTLYAKWTPVSEDTFTVTFNTNGGSPVSTVQVANGGYVPEPLFPTKEGFNFMGWYLDAELEIEWLFYVNTVSSDMTLYAAWEAIPEEYSVTFNVDGGTVISAVSVYENEKISLPTDPEKTGYRFAGWYTDEALTNVWDFSADVVTENMQLYAKWKTPTDFNNTFKVLSIGNSFSEDAQRYLWSIANSYGIDPENIVVANMYIGGCSLATHVANMISDSPAYTYQLYTSASISTQAGMKLSTALTLEDWDVITIQQVSQDSGMPSSYSDYVVRLVEYIEANATNPNVQIMWHMTWAYAQTSTHSGFLNYGSDQQTMYHAIINAVNQKILTVAQIESVIPSVTAIQNARTSYIGDYFNRDGYHLSDPLGRYIAGLMFFKQITGFDVSPSTIAYMPTGVSELQQQLAMEAVNNAYQSRYQVVASTYTTAPEPEVIDVNGVEFDFDYVQGFWNDNATAVAPSTDALYNSFAAVMPIPKYMLPVGSEIVIAEGYQYRVIFFEKVGEGYHVVYRTALYQTPYIEVDEAFWGNYDYVGFNITTNPTSAINTRLDEVVGLFHLYHPEGTGEGHVDSELAWTSGLWEVAGTSLTSNVNYLSSNPLTPGYFDTDDIFEVVSGYKFAYAVLSFDAGVYTVESVSAFQTEPLLLSASFKEGKELIAFIVTTTNEDMDLSSADLTTVVDIHPLAVPHTDATISFISGYWELGKHEVTTTNSNMEWLQGYAASAPQSKHYYENINAITIEAGYQVRVIYLEYDGYGQYTVALRSDNLTGTITLDETFWGSYEYIAFNISAVPAQNLSTQLDSLSEKFSYDVDPLVFGLGYWNTNGTALSASTVYAGSNPLPRQFMTEGTVITLESGYQVRVIFLSYSEENGYLVVSRSENFVGSFVLTDGLYQNYQYIAFNISTSPSTSDLTAALDTLPEKIVATEFTDTLVNHVDQPLTFVSGYWNNFAQAVTTGDTTFIKGFAASNVLSKDVLGIVSQIVIAEGYQVRVIYLDYSYNTYSVLLRTDNLVGTITLDDTFWGDYQYVAFNISSIPSTDLSGVLETLPDLITMVGEGVLHVDTELSWTSGLWETTQTELTPNVNYVS